MPPITPQTIVRARLKERRMMQRELAEQLGIRQSVLSRTLGSDLVRPDSHWPAILEALGLEVIIRPIEGDSDGE